MIVALGQPGYFSWLGSVSAAGGYALFWRYVFFFPERAERFKRALIWALLLAASQLVWLQALSPTAEGFWIPRILWVILFSLQFACITLAIPYGIKITLFRIFVLSAGWTLMEWSRAILLRGYDWSLTQGALAQLPSILLASLIGGLGLAFWVIFVNFLAFKTLMQKRIRPFGLWAIAAIFPYLYGMAYTYYTDYAARSEKPFELACIHANEDVCASLSKKELSKQLFTVLKTAADLPLDLLLLPSSFLSEETQEGKDMQAAYDEVFGEEPQSLHTEINKSVYWVQQLSNRLHSEIALDLASAPKQQSFLFWKAPVQCLERAKILAVENGLPLFHVDATGIRSLIDAHGRATVQPQESQTTTAPFFVIRSEVQGGPRGLFHVWGNAGIVLFCSACVALFFLSRLFNSVLKLYLTQNIK